MFMNSYIFMSAVPGRYKIKKFFNLGSEKKLQKSIAIVHDFAHKIIRSRLEEPRARSRRMSKKWRFVIMIHEKHTQHWFTWISQRHCHQLHFSGAGHDIISSFLVLLAPIFKARRGGKNLERVRNHSTKKSKVNHWYLQIWWAARIALSSGSNFRGHEAVSTSTNRHKVLQKRWYFAWWHFCWEELVYVIPHVCYGKNRKHLGQRLQGLSARKVAWKWDLETRKSFQVSSVPRWAENLPWERYGLYSDEIHCCSGFAKVSIGCAVGKGQVPWVFVIFDPEDEEWVACQSTAENCVTQYVHFIYVFLLVFSCVLRYTHRPIQTHTAPNLLFHNTCSTTYTTSLMRCSKK